MEADKQSPNARRVQIQVPEQYKQIADDIWDDLELYLYQGFLTSSAHISDKTFVFKTLNHHELRYIQMLKPMRQAPVTVRDSFRAQFISHSIFLLDGENVLVNRPTHIGRFTRIIQKFDPGLQEKIVESLAALNAKASRLHPLTEVYVHENRSRFKWMHVQHSPIHSPLNTGISGTDGLGMNYCQQAWIALNKLIDSKETMEREWMNAKFIGSCFAGKGVRAVDERDRAKRERERTELEDRKIKVLYQYLNRVPGADGKEAPNVVTLPDGRQASVVKKFQAESVESLADQLSAALSGEKDHHDLIVEAKVRQLRERAGQIEQSRKNLYRAPALNAPQIEQNPLATGARVLSGKSEAESILANLRLHQLTSVERFHRRISGDSENSDDRGLAGDKKA